MGFKHSQELTDHIITILENDSHSYHLFRGEAKRFREDAPYTESVKSGMVTEKECVIFALEDSIKDYFEDWIDEANAGPATEADHPAHSLVSAMVRHSFELIDFRAIARYYESPPV